MKKILLLALTIALHHFMYAQAGEWTWMKGDNQPFSSGNFGTQGVSSPTNLPPAHYSYTPWKDHEGNFWIFGGDASNVFFSDLWKYDPVTNEWTWMRGTGLASQPAVYGTQGIPSPNNYPGARSFGARSWTDDSNYLWLCGGTGYDAFSSGELNDLWRYDIATNEWTWMNGNNTVNAPGVYGTFQVPAPLNTPGGRHESTACWNDVNGNLWFYGGYSYCDMWKYDPSINEWAWMNGTSGSLPPSYGVQGVPSATNTPGSRPSYSHFVDTAGNFWLFGGADPSILTYADLWKYNPVTNEWTWINGSQATGNDGNAGQLCDTSLQYYPQSRFENRCCWTDNCGHFWLTGGTHDFFNSALNDLWVFDPATFEWALVNGSSSANAATVTGTQGVSAPTNNPGGMLCSVGFVDASNNLYEFGGSQSPITPFNDLWRFVIDTDCPALNYACCSVSQSSFAASDTMLCEKFCISFFDSSQNNPIAWQWLFEGGAPPSSTDQNPANICYQVPGVYDVTLITTSANGNDTVTLSNFITVYPTPPFPTITQTGYTLTSSPANSYQWQLNTIDIPGATNQSYTVLQSGYYTVVVGDSNSCKNSTTTYVLISGVEDVSDKSISISPNPSNGNFMVEWLNGQMVGDASIDVVNTLGQKVFSSSEKNLPGGSQASSYGFKKQIDLNNVDRGIYFVEIKTENEFVMKKIVIAD
ncbi:MAG TPA: kelch repeat-containing protein [Chitinophagales bacterium]|nr:kelch repeat-containing protein [Chitinophagales bacterium]